MVIIMSGKTLKYLVIGATVLMWSVLFLAEASLISLYNVRMANLSTYPSTEIVTEIDNQ